MYTHPLQCHDEIYGIRLYAYLTISSVFSDKQNAYSVMEIVGYHLTALLVEEEAALPSMFTFRESNIHVVCVYKKGIVVTKKHYSMMKA